MEQSAEVFTANNATESKKTARPKPAEAEDASRRPSNRIFFAAMTAGFNIRICERMADRSVRAMLWSKLTKAERRRGQRFIQQLAPDSKTLACAGPCAWTKSNGPKTEGDAKALAEFVAAMELRHGAQI
jgi:hypothetical protein